ncbi:MAG: hypothetical protein IKF22_12090 [Lachnospiraceae bacterium]|nr:hypothetical protein [Lachnospiraceae bacterium]
MITILSSKAAPSKIVDGVTKSREVFCLVGLSSDTKPTTSYKNILICNGSSFIEVDTGTTYMYDEEGATWHEQAGGGSGSGGGGCSAADVVAIVQLATNNQPIPRHVIAGETTYELTAQWGHKYVFDEDLEALSVSLPTAPTEVEATVTIEILKVNEEGLALTLPEGLNVYGSAPIAGEAYELNVNESLRAFANSYPLPEEEEEEGGA